MKSLLLFVFRLIYLPIWWITGYIPRNKRIWVFASWFGDKYTDNSRIFFEWLQKEHNNMIIYWITRNKKLVLQLQKKGYPVLLESSLKAKIIMLRASKYFTSNGYDIDYKFGNGSSYIMLWHGMPLKKICKDDNNSGGKKAKNKLVSIYRNIYKKCFPWTTAFETYKTRYTIANADFFIPFLKSAFSLKDENLIRSGSPRCDALFYNNSEKLIKEIRSKFPNCTIIFYMPTFRTSSWTKKAFNPFTEEFQFDLTKFTSCLENNNIVFVYKPHPVDLLYMKDKLKNNRIITISDEDFDELYNFTGQVDILMTDYSSIYFDFICLKKPVILAPFDLQEYVANCRNHYFDYSLLEGIRAKNWDDVINIVTNKSYYIASNETIKQFAEFIDGNSCPKLLDFLKEI